MNDPDPLAEALARRDLHGLRRELDARPDAPDALAALLREGGAAAHAALAHIERRLRSLPSAAACAAHAAALPGSLEGLWPESQRLLADLYLRLGPYLGERALPGFRGLALLPQVEVRWLRTEASLRPRSLAAERGSEMLYQAVSSLDLGQVDLVAELLEALIGHDDEYLKTRGGALVLEALGRGLLAPRRVRALLLELAQGASAPAARLALGALAEPWALCFPYPHRQMAGHLRAGGPLLGLALTVATGHGADRPLWQVLDDPAAPLAQRQQAMRLLGRVLRGDGVAPLLEAAATDPLLFGAPLVSALRDLHRRGIFVPSDQADALLEIYLGDQGIAAAEIAALAFPARAALLALLGAVPPDDRRWIRLAELLVAFEQSAAGEASGHAPAALLASALEASGSPAVQRALIAALGLAGGPSAEAPVLALLDRHPAACLQALTALGGAATREALWAKLGFEREGDQVTPALEAEQAGALTLLWQLCADDAPLRAAILTRLDPRALPPAIAADLRPLPGHDERRLRLGSGQDRSALGQLERLASLGDGADLPALRDLLLRLVRELHAGVGGGDAPRGEEQRSLPTAALRSLRELGEQLHDRRRVRPACLVEAATRQQAGQRLLAALLLELLTLPGLDPFERVILLKALAPLPDLRGAPVAAHAGRLLRHRDPRVRREAIAYLAAHGAEDLAASLTAMTRSEDIQPLRQSLLALGGLGASWAARQIADCLDHPNMNVKKAAAEALCRAGAPSAAPRLLHWLGHQDNPGLRALLLAALRASLGEGYRGALLSALDASSSAEQTALLLRTLDGALSPRAVAAALRQGARWAPAFLSLLADERAALGEGSLGELAFELARSGLENHLPAAARQAPSPALARLVEGGWNHQAALALLEEAGRAPLGSAQAEALRRFLVEWVVLSSALGPPLRRRAVGVVLEVARAGLTDHEIDTLRPHAHLLVDWLALGDEARPLAHDLLARLLPRLDPAQALGAARQLRALPHGPNLGARSTLGLLRLAGAILTRADLERALEEAARTSDPTAIALRALEEAFGQRAGTPPLEAALRDRLDAVVRAGDLAALLALRASMEASSREVLGALLPLVPAAPAALRSPLLDWMLALQPIDTPAWSLGEGFQQESRRASRTGPRARAPRSLGALAGHLRLASVDDQATREKAALALLDYPEDSGPEIVVRLYLAGRVRAAPTCAMADTYARLLPEERRSFEQAGGEVRGRLIALLVRASPGDLPQALPSLLDAWAGGSPELSALAREALDRVDPDTLFLAAAPRMLEGAWGHVDLLGRGVTSGPMSERVVARARREGRAEIEKGLRLRPSPLLSPGTEPDPERDLEAPRSLPALPARAPLCADDLPPLLVGARGADLEPARAAMTRLAKDPTPEVLRMLGEQVHHRSPRIRLLAHRLLRGLDRGLYLEASRALLDDPLPAIQRSAIRIVTHARHTPALPRLVELVLHAHPAVKRAAEQGLLLLGAPALPAIERVLSRTRPDRRSAYLRLLAAIEARPGLGTEEERAADTRGEGER